MLVIEYGADLFLKDDYGLSPLLNAARKNCILVIEAAQPAFDCFKHQEIWEEAVNESLFCGSHDSYFFLKKYINNETDYHILNFELITANGPFQFSPNPIKYELIDIFDKICNGLNILNNIWNIDTKNIIPIESNIIFIDEEYIFDKNIKKLINDCIMNRTLVNYLVDNKGNNNEIVEDILDNTANKTLIGIDLEYYSTDRNGCVCLLQISDGYTTLVIDTIKLRDHISKCNMLHRLFLNKNIIKIFHGAGGCDLRWLLCDFGFHFFNIFDTYNTSKIYFKKNKINGGLSLEYISNYFLNYPLQKIYQQSDWRIRPLPKPMIRYAANDACVLPFLCRKILKELMGNSSTRNTHTLISDNQIITNPTSTSHSHNDTITDQTPANHNETITNQTLTSHNDTITNQSSTSHNGTISNETSDSYNDVLINHTSTNIISDVSLAFIHSNRQTILEGIFINDTFSKNKILQKLPMFPGYHQILKFKI
eukprot:GHVL01002258.1.p1 GENE.GHVL01002258.1~~GHVL01002258.1.p1  ORF type:complete len:481 (+),score=119.31 GHVL01002258.1:1548-2990(+)